MAVVHYTEADFNKEIVEAKKEAIVDFWAPWCGPCKMLGPILDSAAAELEGKVTVAKVNIDEEGALAERFGVMTIPTLIVFKDGKEVKRSVGLIPKDAILELV
ncbi:MAG: thioredoxin [Angelakisella sp.]|nr:thioredoxin [Angelakisella sp.]